MSPGLIGRFEAVAPLGILRIDGHRRDPAAALLGAGAIALVGQVVLERGEEEGPEAALGGIDAVEKVALQELEEEPLGQVLGVGGSMAAAAHEGVERRPVGAAEFFQRRAGAGGAVPAGGQHEAPVRGGKRFAGARSGAVRTGFRSLTGSFQTRTGLHRAASMTDDARPETQVRSTAQFSARIAWTSPERRYFTALRTSQSQRTRSASRVG